MKLENLDKAVELAEELDDVKGLIESVEKIERIKLITKATIDYDIDFEQIPNNKKILNQIKAYALKEFQARKEDIEKEIKALD